MMRYIVPISLLIATLLLALFQPIAYSYVPLLIILGLIGCTLFLKASYQKVHISSQLIETNAKQPTIHLVLQKQHRLRIQGTYTIVCQHSISEEQQVFSGTFSTADMHHVIKIPVQWRYCGQMTVNQATISFTDPLAWSQLTQTVFCTEQVILWPTLQPVDRQQLTGVAYTVMGYDTGATERMMPYVPGDAIQSIHWPLSAKLQTMMVQKPAFAETASEQLALYFNDLVQIEDYEMFMSQCYSLLLQEGIDEVVVWTGHWQSFSVQQPQEVAALFDYLLRQPLAQLHADSLPENSYTLIRYEGGQIA